MVAKIITRKRNPKIVKEELQGHMLNKFEGCVHYILASLFLSLKRALVKLGKMFFISLQKLCFCSRKNQILEF